MSFLFLFSSFFFPPAYFLFGLVSAFHIGELPQLSVDLFYPSMWRSEASGGGGLLVDIPVDRSTGKLVLSLGSPNGSVWVSFSWLPILSRGESAPLPVWVLILHFLSGPVLHFQGGGGNPSTWGIDSLSNPGAFDGGLIPASCSSCPENKPLIFQQQKSEERCFILSFSVCHVFLSFSPD